MTSLKWLIEDFGVKEIIANDSAVSDLKGENGISDLNLHAWNQNFKQQLFPGLLAEVLYAGKEPGKEWIFPLHLQGIDYYL